MIGIVGGVGPLAGVDLHTKIIKNTPARTDQEHLPIVHISCPHRITDRTAYYLDRSLKNPAHDIFQIIGQLVDLGCTLIGIPCNSAHIPCIRDELDSMLLQAYGKSVTVFHLIEELASFLEEQRIMSVGILATKASIQSRLYHDVLEAKEIRVIAPGTEERIEQVHDSIYHKEYGIKSHFPVREQATEILLEEARQLAKEGAESIIMGCTEIPLALTQSMIDVPLIDATELLAKAMIRNYGKKL